MKNIFYNIGHVLLLAVLIQLTIKKVMKIILRFKVIFEKIDNAENKKVLYELFKAVKDSKTVSQLYH